MNHGTRSSYIHAKCRCNACTEANREYMAGYYRAHKDEWYKPDRELDKIRKAADYRKYKEKRLAQQREYREKYRARKAAYDRIYNKSADGRATAYRYNAKRRAIKRGAATEAIDRLVALAEYLGLCGICGDPVDPDHFHVDHILPLNQGGGHLYGNCRPTHPSCNLSRKKQI